MYPGGIVGQLGHCHAVPHTTLASAVQVDKGSYRYASWRLSLRLRVLVRAEVPLLQQRLDDFAAPDGEDAAAREDALVSDISRETQLLAERRHGRTRRKTGDAPEKRVANPVRLLAAPLQPHRRLELLACRRPRGQLQAVVLRDGEHGRLARVCRCALAAPGGRRRRGRGGRRRRGVRRGGGREARRRVVARRRRDGRGRRRGTAAVRRVAAAHPLGAECRCGQVKRRRRCERGRALVVEVGRRGGEELAERDRRLT